MTAIAQIGRSTRKPKGEGHERRGEILAAAERIFVEKGYEGATIRKIAEEVGLSSTALYMHFADKAEILNEICRTAFEGLLQRQLECMSTCTDALTCVGELAHGYINFGFDHPNAYRLAFMTPTLLAADGSQTVAQKTAAELYQTFETAVGRAIEAGTLHGDRAVLTQALWASVHGLVSLMITKPHFAWADRAQLVDAQINGMLKGFSRP